MNINIGISENKRIETAKGLSVLLADSYTMYLKTHNYHWNVTGPMFTTLHELFEEQYNHLAEAVDEIAERIRILGVRAPGSYREFAELTSIKEDVNTPGAQEMIQNLLSGHEQIVNTSKGILPTLEGGNDEGTLSLLSARIEYHEKTAWVLRSMLA
jgi:starvation-inducible DNA-binding protein